MNSLVAYDSTSSSSSDDERVPQSSESQTIQDSGTPEDTSKVSKYFCSEHQKSYKYKRGLHQHIRNKHNATQPVSQPKDVICSVCNFATTHQSRLVSHLKTHNKEPKAQKRILPFYNSQSKAITRRDDPQDIDRVPGLQSDLKDPEYGPILRRNWRYIRNHVERSPTQTHESHTFRITETFNLNFLRKCLESVHSQQKLWQYRLNIHLSLLLHNNTDNSLHFYYPSANTSIFEQDQLIQNSESINEVIGQLDSEDVLDKVINQSRKDTKYVLVQVLAVTVTVAKLSFVPIRGGQILPDYIRNTKAIIGLDSNWHGTPYEDSKCFFRSLALFWGANIRSLETPTNDLIAFWCEHKNIPVQSFDGITSLEELDQLEICFEIPIAVYSLIPHTRKIRRHQRSERTENPFILSEAQETEDSGDDLADDLEEMLIMDEEQQSAAVEANSFVAILRRESKYPGTFDETLKLNLFDDKHFSYIKDFNNYSKCFMCSICDKTFKQIFELNRHIFTCTPGTQEKFTGNGYSSPPTVFELLDRYGYHVEQSDRFFSSFIVFDLEATNQDLEVQEFIGTTPCYIPFPTIDPYDPPENIAPFIHEHWKFLRTEIIGNEHYRIRGSSIEEIIQQLLSISGQQLFRFAIRVSCQINKQGKRTVHKILETPTVILNDSHINSAIELIRKNFYETKPPPFEPLSFSIYIQQFKLSYLRSLEAASVSICSNVVGFTDPKFIVCSDDSTEARGVLMTEMIDYMEQISDTVYESYKLKFKDIFDSLSERIKDTKSNLREFRNAYPDICQKLTRSLVPAYQRRIYWVMHSKLIELQNLHHRLDKWSRHTPNVGFNSGAFDLNLCRRDLFKEILARLRESNPDKIHSLKPLKRGNKYLCLATDKLRFLDVSAYLAPGTSYAKFLKAYGIEQKKGFFPYNWFQSIDQLSLRRLPDRSAFYNSLKGTDISEEDYNFLQNTWTELGFETMLDLLKWYNNLDVKPFCLALSKLKDFWQSRGIDALKDGISLPGLALKDLFQNQTPPHTLFVLEDQLHSHLYHNIKTNITGGPASVFHRLHMANLTRLRNAVFGKLVKKIVSYDANALYLYCLMRQMATGLPYIWQYRELDHLFHRSQMYKRCHSETMWLEWTSYQKSIEAGSEYKIHHRFNSSKQARIENYSVDGIHYESKTIYQFNGCSTHGHICHLNKNPDWGGLTANERREKTQEIRQNIINAGYTVIDITECSWRLICQRPNVKSFLDEHFVSTPGRPINQTRFLSDVLDGTFFGYLEVDIITPPNLREFFADFPPIFRNILVERKHIGKHMAEYAESQGILKQPRRNLCNIYDAKNVILLSSQLQWYLQMGLIVEKIHYAVEYKGKTCFANAGISIANARRDGDRNPDLAIIGDQMKLLGNSYAGKSITNVLKHKETKILLEEHAQELSNQNSTRSPTSTVISPGIIELSMNKRIVEHSLPHLIGFFVYGEAKVNRKLNPLRMLQFYYDFLKKYFHESDFQLCLCDTDSFVLALSEDSIDDLTPKIPLPEDVRNSFLPRKDPQFTTYDNRTPGLFKVEYSGNGLVALAAKCYHLCGDTDKCSHKGLSKTLNFPTHEEYQSVLETKKTYIGQNQGFQVKPHADGQGIKSYQLYKDGLSYFYCKRKVLDDGISTAPLDL